MNAENPRILVLIPAYNEAGSIQAVVDLVRNEGYDYLVINDGSRDETGDICRREGFSFLDLKENLGIGGAMQAGHRYAYENGYDVDVQFDGDGQHEVSCIPLLLRGIDQGADLVIGSRFLEESDGFKSTIMRRAGIKWLSGAIRLVSHLRVTDPTSGFRAADRKVMELFRTDYPSDYPEPESIVAANKLGLSIREVQVSMHERQSGVSSIKPISAAYYMVKVTLAILIAGIKRPRRNR